MDLLFCHQTFHHLIRQQATLEEFYRVLKPGGLLLFAESTRIYINSCIIRLLFRHPKQSQHSAVQYMAMIRAQGFILVGHSRGGFVAMRTAQVRPALVKKLVLMEGAFHALLDKPGETDPGLPARAKVIKARFDQGDIDGGLELFIDRDNTGTWARRREEDRQRTRDNAWTLIAGESDDPVTCADVGGLKMPVLLLQGEKTPRQYAMIVDATHKCLPSAERATIADAAHAMHVMNPSAFEKILVQFLSS